MEEHEVLRGLALTIILGVSSQWVAWRLRLPSILLLLVVGFFAGHLGVLDPDRTFTRPFLFQAASLAVALILFEGGLTLRFRELDAAGAVVFRLITIGVLVTWAVGAFAAWQLLGLSAELSLLAGAILTVTGPTVVGPLLRHIRPTGPAGSILKWEGILVDPVGAILAVLVFQAVSEGRIADAPFLVLRGAIESLLVGLLVGGAAAFVLIPALRRHWIPDGLQSAAALALVVAASWAANSLHHESGLLAVTIMGLALANQKHAPYRHILEFKENLRVLLISSLFIVLAARVRLEEIEAVGVPGVLFALVLILVARPLSVAASTWRTDLPLKARAFVAWMAPRGIVAAAVTSVFANRLAASDTPYSGHVDLVPVVFLVIVCTVLVYGLTAFPLALRLGLAQKNPQGVLILGAHRFGRAIGSALRDAGFPVLMVDSNYRQAAKARMEGLRVWHGNILSEHADEELDLAGIGRALCITPNDEANSLASMHLRELFGRQELYQLAFEASSEGPKSTEVPLDLRGRTLFAEDLTYNELDRRMLAGWSVKTTPLTEKFTFEDWRARHGEDAVPLFLITSGKRLVPFTATNPPAPEPGSTLVALVPKDETGEPTGDTTPSP